MVSQFETTCTPIPLMVNYILTRFLGALATIGFLFVPLVLSTKGDRNLVLEVSTIDELWEAEELVSDPNASSFNRIVIKLRPNVYRLSESFNIGRSRVDLVGQPGVTFVLADSVNMPVIAVGSQDFYLTEEDLIEDISISGIEIDGNRNGQSSEFVESKPWIRNNGIDIRAVTDMTVDSVVANNNRSGGLVISWKSSDIEVTNSLFENNFFDGVAYYDCIRVYTINCSMNDNQFAGISLDNSVKESSFEDCSINRNGAVGIFARHSFDVSFKNCFVANSNDWAVFLAHDEKDLGVHNITFNRCYLKENRGGLFMASTSEEQSSRIYVVDSKFEGNEISGRLNIQTSGSRIYTALPEIAQFSEEN